MFHRGRLRRSWSNPNSGFYSHAYPSPFSHTDTFPHSFSQSNSDYYSHADSHSYTSSHTLADSYPYSFNGGHICFYWEPRFSAANWRICCWFQSSR